MPMSYTSLVAPKGTTGAIANWVGYEKIDIVTILEEAQSIIFQALRIREMRTTYAFSLPEGNIGVALPDRFLDPIGPITDQRGLQYLQQTPTDVQRRRVFEDESSTGALPNNPFTTIAGSSSFTVNIPNHDLTGGSDITFSNAPTLDGVNFNGTFYVSFLIDDNTISCLAQDATFTGMTGGGAAVTWEANVLTKATPACWSIFDEALYFDLATDTDLQCRLLYYRSPPLLSTTNPTNFLTSRYPRLIREATNAAAASMMKDDNEEQKALQKLAALIDATNVESDMTYRGAILTTDTPTPGDYY